MKKINLKKKFSLFSDYWSPKIVGELNDNHVKLAKFKGVFDWHHHESEDELFLVIKGTLVIEFRDQIITLNEGELLIVPKGVEHRPVAQEEVEVLLVEPKSTLNTGNVQTERTVSDLDWI